MPATLDIPDTQVWIYAMYENRSFPGALDLYNEVLSGERLVYVPRYVLTEVYSAARKIDQSSGHDRAFRFHRVLSNADSVICPDHDSRRGFRVDLDEKRRQPETTALAAALDMEPKDAPIVAIAHRLPSFVAAHDPPTHGARGIPRGSVEYELVSFLERADVSRISTRVVTCEKDFVGVDQVPLDFVSVQSIR